MFIAERRSNAPMISLAAVNQPEELADRIDEIASLGEPRVNFSLFGIDTLDYSTLQTLLATREYCIRRGLVMRLVEVSSEVQERIRWADAGRLLEDDLMLV